MKIVLKISEDENSSAVHTLEIDGREAQWIHDLGECPEDARIGRDLIDGKDIISYICLGYAAGKAGEELEVEIIKE